MNWNWFYGLPDPDEPTPSYIIPEPKRPTIDYELVAKNKKDSTQLILKDPNVLFSKHNIMPDYECDAWVLVVVVVMIRYHVFF